MEFYPTKDIKLASCLIALGVPKRDSDPVTREVQERNGRPFDQYTFWFDIGEESNKSNCVSIVQAYEKAKAFFLMPADGPPSADYVLGIEHPLYYMMGVLFNRETLLHWMRSDVEPMKIIKDGTRTVIISTRASQETKDKIKKYL